MEWFSDLPTCGRRCVLSVAVWRPTGLPPSPAVSGSVARKTQGNPGPSPLSLPGPRPQDTSPRPCLVQTWAGMVAERS